MQGSENRIGSKEKPNATNVVAVAKRRKPMKADFEKIADISGILEQMKKGTPPWVRDWNDPPSRHFPYNVTTMKDDPTQTYR